jgi:hypothetical protein
MKAGQLHVYGGGIIILIDGKPFKVGNDTTVLIDGAPLLKIYADMVNDLLLVASMYHGDYPFDEDHKAKQSDLFDKAHHLLGVTMESLGASVDWLAPTDRTIDDYQAVAEAA